MTGGLGGGSVSVLASYVLTRVRDGLPVKGRISGRWIAALILMLPLLASGQRMVISSGTISFFSEAPLENIKAGNTRVTSIFEPTSGKIAFAIPMREFQFDKSLMQQHFNDKYLESDKYPNSVFSGMVQGYSQDDKTSQTVKALGELTIHGVKRRVEIPGTIEQSADELHMKSKFVVHIADYDITIPQLLWQNIAEDVEVEVDLYYKQQ